MGLNSFQLKWIAIIAMAVDHTGAVLYPQEPLFRAVGRLAFPIFCFLLVEGFFHTRDVYRYMGRLFLFAILSEVPYDLALTGTIWDISGQNVFFTLTAGVFLMHLMERSREIPVKVIDILLVMWAVEIFRTDYAFRGILLIVIYYICRDKKWQKLCAGAAWNLLYGPGKIQCCGVAATVPIALYNGERGNGNRNFFYLFYPLHLLFLYGMKVWIYG